jgi:hypothetical protein
VKDPASPPVVPGSHEVTHWLVRESRAADGGSVGRVVARRAWELAAVAIVVVGVLGCCACPGLVLMPYLLQPYGRVFTAWRRRRAVREGSQSRPAEPWTWDVDAPQGGVERPFARTWRGRKRLFAGLVVLAFAVLVGVALGPPFRAFAAIAGVPAVLFLWLGYRDVRTGRIRVDWSSWPIVCGGRAELILGVSDGGARFERATVRLRAIEEYPSKVHLVWCTWTDVRDVASEAAPGPGHDVLVAFDVPAAARGTRLDVPEACWWELEVTGASDAGPIRERFVVPIYDPPPPVLTEPDSS